MEGLILDFYIFIRLSFTPSRMGCQTNNKCMQQLHKYSETTYALLHYIYCMAVVVALLHEKTVVARNITLTH